MFRSVVNEALVLAALATPTLGDVLVNYQADTLPPDPWVRVSNGRAPERASHSTFVSDGVLRMIDETLLSGNTLGYYRHVSFRPAQIIDVEFRTRVFSGESLNRTADRRDEYAPFAVWIHNGSVRAGLSVGPTFITSRGPGRTLLIDQPIDGRSWHTYRFVLDSVEIQWWVDGALVMTAPIDSLIQRVTDTDRRINMFITGATADVELDYIVVRQAVRPGDWDVDGDVDLQDFMGFVGCFTGPDGVGVPDCLIALDFDSDGDVDLMDFESFQEAFTGSR